MPCRLAIYVCHSTILYYVLNNFIIGVASGVMHFQILHGFAMPKGEFCDALYLRFGWHLVRLPLSCVCGKSFIVEHAFRHPCGSFPTIHHKEIRDVTASLLSEVCLDVGVESALQPLNCKPL